MNHRFTFLKKDLKKYIIKNRFNIHMYKIYGAQNLNTMTIKQERQAIHKQMK